MDLLLFLFNNHSLTHLLSLYIFYTTYMHKQSGGYIYIFIGGDKEEYYTRKIKYIIREGGRFGGGGYWRIAS